MIVISLLVSAITALWELRVPLQISTPALVLFNYVALVGLGGAIYFTQARVWRVARALFGGLAFKIAGPRVSLESIAYAFLSGRSAEAIAAAFPVLSLERTGQGATVPTALRRLEITRSC